MNEIYNKLLDLAWKNFDFIFQSKSNLENKANMILAANGVLLGFVLNGFNNMNKGFAVGCIFFLLLSSYFCVCVLKTKLYKMLGVSETWNALSRRNLLTDSDEAYQNFLGTIEGANNTNLKNYEELVDCFKPALNLFLLALLLLGLAIVVPLFVLQKVG
jgi:hypothetical protein